MDLRLSLAVFTGKLIATLARLVGGGATAAPGLYALKIDPNLVKKLAKKIKHGSIIVSGTNGKTTTARLIYDILSTKYEIIHNRQGSNLLRGIASTFINRCSLLGKLGYNFGLWEVDEATLPEAIKNVYPRTIVLLNLFRDQLDRYGEVDSIRNKWQKALGKVSQNATLVFNADDPGISILEKSSRGKKIFFGVNDNKISLPEVASVVDIKHCLICGSDLLFDVQLSAHLGHYRCPNCSFRRPSPQISATNTKFSRNFSTKTILTINSKRLPINSQLPGLYNVYNVLAATAVTSSYRIDPQIVRDKIRKFSTAFGRFQKIKVNGKELVTFLIKNPTGANEVIRTISLQPKVNILIILNDKIADGRDVSWIWDTNWEILKDKTKKIFVGGIRCFDMALRLKYAGLRLSKNYIYKEANYSIINALKKMSTKDTLIILPTYTALLAVQNTLTQISKKAIKWQHQ